MSLLLNLFVSLPENKPSHIGQGRGFGDRVPYHAIPKCQKSERKCRVLSSAPRSIDASECFTCSCRQESAPELFNTIRRRKGELDENIKKSRFEAKLRVGSLELRLWQGLYHVKTRSRLNGRESGTRRIKCGSLIGKVSYQSGRGRSKLPILWHASLHNLENGISLSGSSLAPLAPVAAQRPVHVHPIVPTAAGP